MSGQDDARRILQALARPTEPYHQPSYDELIDEFGTVLLKASDGAYQGDTYVLLQYDNDYGYLNFGWGSCSGCDALEGCGSWAELDELRDTLSDQIHWEEGAEKMLGWWLAKDWGGEYNSMDEAKQQFVVDGRKILEIAVEKERTE